MTIIEWDYREQPDWEAIQTAVTRECVPVAVPGLTLVPDTGSDQYALLVTSSRLAEGEAQRLYDEARGPVG